MGNKHLRAAVPLLNMGFYRALFDKGKSPSLSGNNRIGDSKKIAQPLV
ncbi:hypothetical protein CLV25_102171 [Acetobacteroides hydrogenigenes]|uniref:Uncharacterized protein n=1 Tax=Acetobacteroides hydrogenigenes TaxID=979970 RepID=A0A4R2ESI6_9BACT|nr:hypothetical protein CLV25_102171 [Acetobacteroides hydrogenigenes]